MQTLIKFCKEGEEGEEAVWPEKFHGWTDPIITMDEETKQHIAVTIKTVEKVDDFSPVKKHVLVYKVKADLHTVFVKRQLKLKRKPSFECVNSWGHHHPYPIIEIKPGNVLYKVEAGWELASQG